MNFINSNASSSLVRAGGVGGGMGAVSSAI
jgi:hypothetical protein